MTATISNLEAGLLGSALIGLSLVAVIRISPSVGGPFFDRHVILRAIQRYFTPLTLGMIGLGMVIAAIVR